MDKFKTLFWLIDEAIFLQSEGKKLKRKGILFYLKALQAIRKGLAGTLLIVLVFQTMMLGFFGACAALLFLFVPDPQLRLYLILALCLLAFLIPLVLISVLLSDRLWFKASGAERLLEE